MAGEGSEISKKRPFVDLDNVQETVLPIANPELATGSSEPSSSMGKRCKTSANPDMPGREFLVKSREIVVHFYEIRSLNVLRRMYMGLFEEGFHKLSDDLCEELERRFEESEAFNNYTDYWLHQEWLDRQVITLTTNIVANWTYHTGKKADAPDLTDKERDTVAKLKEIQIWVQSFSHLRRKKAEQKGTIVDEIQAHCISGMFQWLPSSARIVRMPDKKAEGGYGWVRKVMITKLKSIPSWILFAEKSLKTKDEGQKRREIVNEAGGCPVKHPGIIRLAYLHPLTMAGYTLWWNGGSLESFWSKYDSKVHLGTPNEQIASLPNSELTIPELERVATYRNHRVDLALSLLRIVGACHDAKYIHNDISPSNVLLHFDEWKADTVYIGICDWGLSSRVLENEPSKYGYTTMEELKKVRALRKFAAPELFFIYGVEGSRNSYEDEKKKHLYSMAADAYAVGWIAKKIWDEDWDKKYFAPSKTEQFMNLMVKLDSLQKEDVEDRASVSEVLDVLTKAPHHWSLPSCCFRT